MIDSEQVNAESTHTARLHDTPRRGRSLPECGLKFRRRLEAMKEKNLGSPRPTRGELRAKRTGKRHQRDAPHEQPDGLVDGECVLGKTEEILQTSGGCDRQGREKRNT